MQKTLLTLILSFFYFLSSAQDSGSGLIVSSGGENFILFLNSQKANDIAAALVRADNLQIGKNRVRISFVKKGVPELTAEVILPNDGFDHELTYRIVKTPKGPYKFEKVGDLTLSPFVIEDIENSIGTSKDKPLPNATKPEKPVNNKAVANENGNPGVVVQVNGTLPSINQVLQVNASSSYQVPQVVNGLMCAQVTTNKQAFLKLKYDASSDLLGSVTSMQAKKFMDNHCMLASEVAELLKVIKNSIVQLDLAKYGYLHTFDQANYGLVVQALSNEISQEELLNFINANSQTIATQNTTIQNGTIQTTTSSNTQKHTITVNMNNDEDVIEEISSTKSTNNQNTQNNWSNSSSNCYPMEESDFEEALEAADDPISEETKMKVAKEVFNKECLTTTQIMQVMEIFINEMKKLEFAKFAYKFCSEKDKYFRLNKAFISELRVRELTDYVKSQR